MTDPTPEHRRSHPGLDVYRGLAVVLMFLAHVWRVQTHDGHRTGVVGSLDALLAWMDRGVAFVAASFLFIAGFSLVLAHRSMDRVGRRTWLLGILRRAAWLYLISFVMFLPEHGFELPDILASSGILSVIAIAVVTTAAALVSAHPDAWLGVLAVTIIGVTYALERLGLPVSGLNAGPGGAIPLILFSALGALVARQYLGHGPKRLLWLGAFTVPFFVGGLVSEDRWLAFYTSEYADHGGLAIAGWLGLTSGAGMVPRTFWNPSALGALGLVAPVVFTTAAHLALQDRFAGHIAVRPLVLLGRHALTIFVAHYAILGLVDLAGLQPPHAGWTLVLLVVLTAISVALCAVIEAIRSRRAIRTS